MKHLFLVLLSLTFSVCVFSLPATVPVPDNPAATVAFEQPAAMPDYSDGFTREAGFYQLQNPIIMQYCKNFGEAIQALRDGKMVKRQTHGEDVFIFMQAPSMIESSAVPRMASLPLLVKQEFERRFNDERLQIQNIYYSDQLAIVDSSNSIRGYSPSVEDAFAGDWVILD
ncbi:MAG: DUF2829 domain-containing protein [Dysgonamonadaceae bacterium]|jgi:hypothetical protein|nr:DUF2829 domain-containing protein [Dysgonamonadaceae bacterium]